MNLSGGFAAGAGADALEGLLTRLFRENEAKQRTRQEQQRIEQDDRRLKMMEADRQAGAADVAKSRAVQNALRISGTMLPGTSLTPDTVGALRTGEMGNLVKHEEADIPSRAISGIASAGAKAPIMGSLRMAAAGRPERDTFTGTADQLTADQARTDRLAAAAEAATAKVEAAKQAALDRKQLQDDAQAGRAELARLVASQRQPETIKIQTVDDQGNAVWKIVPKTAGSEFAASPTTDQRNREAATGRAAPVLKSIADLSERINTGQGVAAKITGAVERAKAQANLNDDVAEYEAVVSGFTPLLARAVGHTGVLTEQDVQSVRKMLPSPMDSKSVRDRKVARIHTIMGEMAPSAAGVGDRGGASPNRIRYDMNGNPIK